MELDHFISMPPGNGCLPGYEAMFNNLVSKLSSRKNIGVVAHRGWGKQYLLKEVGYALKKANRDLCLVFFDLKRVYDTSDFLKAFAEEICRSTSWKNKASSCSRMEFRQILDLPENIARAKKIRLVIFISNFQNFKYIKDSNQVFKVFKHCWRKQIH